MLRNVHANRRVPDLLPETIHFLLQSIAADELPLNTEREVCAIVQELPVDCPINEDEVLESLQLAHLLADNEIQEPGYQGFQLQE